MSEVKDLIGGIYNSERNDWFFGGAGCPLVYN